MDAYLLSQLQMEREIGTNAIIILHHSTTLAVGSKFFVGKEKGQDAKTWLTNSNKNSEDKD